MMSIVLTLDGNRFHQPALRNRPVMRRPQFSWTRIRGESDVEGGGGHGWIEAREGSCVGADGGSPEGDRSRRRRARRLGRGPWRPASVGAQAGSGTWCCGCCAASRLMRSREKSVWRSIAWRRGRPVRWPVSSGCVERGSGRARRSTRGGLVCGAQSGVLARGAAGRRPPCRMRNCWRPFAATWPAPRSRARAIARSTRGCGSSTTSGSRGRGCCG